MALQFPCPHCQATVSLRYLKIGERYMCKSCGNSQRVPDSASSVEYQAGMAQGALQSGRLQPAPAPYPDIYEPIPSNYSLPSYIITNYTLDNQKAIAANTGPHIPFMTAFWTLTGWILTYQLLATFLGFYRISHSDIDESLYRIITGALGIGWTILMTFYVIFDMQGRELRPLELFNFSFAKLREFAPTVLKYFAVAAGVVVFFSFISSGQQFEFGEMSTAGIALAFIGTVIVAPICEEMIFRGYLYTALRSRFHRPSERIAINAMLFSSAHVFIILFLVGASVPYYIFALGYFIAKLYEDSDSIMPCIALHMLNNGLVFLIEVLIYHGYWYSIH